MEIEGLPVSAIVDSGSPVSITSSMCLYDVHKAKVGPEGDWKECQEIKATTLCFCEGVWRHACSGGC